MAIAVARADVARAETDAAKAENAAGLVGAALPVAPPAPPAAAAWTAEPQVNVAVTQSPQEMLIDIGPAPGAHNATVWMFHLRSSVAVNIPAGENQGHTITYHNVVGDVKAVGVYKGRALTLTLPRAAMAGLPHDGVAVIVQQGGYGHVIGAAYVSRPDYYARQ